MGGEKTCCWVDKGTQNSIASLQFLKKTSINVSALKPADINEIVGVGNEYHPVLGILRIPITISGIKIPFEFFILEHPRHPFLLGIDFLEHHKVQIDLDSKQVYIQEKLVGACYVRSQAGLARTDKGVIIPAGSEVDIELRVSRRKPGEVILLEPLPSLHVRNVAGAKCLVRVKRGRAPIRLINPTSKDIYIPNHRVVATVSDIDTNNAHELETRVCKQTPSGSSGIVYAASQASDTENDSQKTDNVFNVPSDGLSESERAELLQFLERNRDVLSTSLRDLERTDLFHHTIKTDPAALPVHLPVYRQSPNIRTETQNLVDEMLEYEIIEYSNSVWNSPVVLVKER